MQLKRKTSRVVRHLNKSKYFEFCKAVYRLSMFESFKNSPDRSGRINIPCSQLIQNPKIPADTCRTCARRHQVCTSIVLSRGRKAKVLCLRHHHADAPFQRDRRRILLCKTSVCLYVVWCSTVIYYSSR